MAHNSSGSQVPSVSEIRRERERNALIERIMDTAREMFVVDGYEAVTLRKIAHAIEYSPGTVYQYFKTKQALIEAIIRGDSEDLREYMLECLTLEEPVEQLVEMARRYVMWGAAHPNHYRLMLLPPPAWAEQLCEGHKKEQVETSLKHQILSVLYLAVETAIKRRRIREKYSDPALIAATLWAGVHGIVLLEIGMKPEDRALMGGRDTSLKARFDTLIEVFLDGFLNDESNE